MGFDVVRSGGCACGAIRYAIRVPPIRGFQCQCEECRRDTGGGHSSVMVFPTEAVVIEGEVREVARIADSGRGKRKGFCGNCGSPIYNKPDSQQEFVGIYVGSLDDASDFKPSLVLFCSRGYDWDLIDPTIPRLSKWHENSD